VAVESDDIEAVGCDVVCGTGKGQKPEESQRPLKPERCRQREGNAGKASADEQLHHKHPPTLRAYGCDEGTPKRFYHPGQIEPRSVESKVGVGEAEPLIHSRRNYHYGNIRKRFGEVKGRHPSVWFFQFIIHNSQFKIIGRGNVCLQPNRFKRYLSLLLQ